MCTVRRKPFRMLSLRGVSLVELMVALAIGLFLLLAIVQIFSSSRASANASVALARVQESGRFALELVKVPFRMGGLDNFCSLPVAPRVHLNTAAGACTGPVNLVYSVDSSVVGFEFVGTGAGDGYVMNADLDPAGANPNQWQAMTSTGVVNLPPFLAGLVVPGSDVLIVRRVEPVVGVTGLGGGTPAQPNFPLTGASGLANDRLAVVTNCSFADVFQNTVNDALARLPAGLCTGPGPGNMDLGWATPNNDAAQIFGLTVEAYFVGFDAAVGEPGLYRADLSQGIPAGGLVAEPLVEGIENMQLRFGLSRARGQEVDDGWWTAELVSDWPRVVALRVSLLGRSPELADALLVSETFNLAGAQVSNVADARLRKPFAATIMLRNRMITP